MTRSQNQTPSTWPRNAPPEGAPNEPILPEPWARETRFDLDMRISVMQRHLRYELFQRMRPLFRHDRLTEPQWRVLRTVGAYSWIDHAGLCRATGLTSCSVSRIVDALSERGLIEREWPIVKRTKRPAIRHYKVVLTRRAQRMLIHTRKEAQTRYLDVEAKFSEYDLRQMYHLMDRFIVALRGAEFETSEEPHRSHPHREHHNGRWIGNREYAKRRELIRAFQEGL